MSVANTVGCMLPAPSARSELRLVLSCFVITAVLELGMKATVFKAAVTFKEQCSSSRCQDPKHQQAPVYKTCTTCKQAPASLEEPLLATTLNVQLHAGTSTLLVVYPNELPSIYSVNCVSKTQDSLAYPTKTSPHASPPSSNHPEAADDLMIAAAANAWLRPHPQAHVSSCQAMTSIPGGQPNAKSSNKLHSRCTLHAEQH